MWFMESLKKLKYLETFFASMPIEDLEVQLIGKKHQTTDLENLFTSMDLTLFFGKVTAEEILDAFK